MLPRRRVADLVGAILSGLWPVVLTLGSLGNPGRYDPVGVYSGLGGSLRALASRPTADPGVFSTAYALGLRASSLLVHGHLGWWNPYEAMGTPLIGELQSGGLFPYSPLLLLHDGSLIFHLALEVTAGVATYFLLRELRCRPVIATLGGMLFATNGTFAWLQNAAFNPVCFVPLLLLGIERSRHAAAEERGGGWRWLAVATALAFAAGFIEVAVLGLGLAVVFAAQRAFTVPKARLAAYGRKVAGGFVVGAAIAAPVLVAFGDYLGVGYVAEHAGNTADHALAAPYVAMTVAPYLFGRIFGSIDPAIHQLWGGVGGYAGFCLLALGIASLFGRRDRGLRITLAAWVGISLADTMGVAPFRQVFSSIPGLDHVVLYRYLPATWELALVVLACMALRDFATRSRVHSVIALVSGVLGATVVLLIGLGLAPDAVRIARAVAGGSFHDAALLAFAASVCLLAAVLLPTKVRALAVGAVAVAEAGVLFCVPLASWPHQTSVDVAVESFLLRHVGTYRFAGLGVPQPNLGSVIGVAQLNVVDLPVPTAFVPIVRRLDPYESPTNFTGTHATSAGELTPEALLDLHVAYYESLGVRYVVTPIVHGPLFARADGVRRVFDDGRFEVWELPHAVALVRAPGCRVVAASFGSAKVSCRHPSTLLVNEQFMPGWAATVNGADVAVTDRGGFQAVALPAGRSTVTLSFLPPDEQLGGLAALVGIVLLVVPFGPLAARRRRRREARVELAGMVQRYERLGELAPTGPQLVAAPDPPTGMLVLGEHELDDVPAPVPATTPEEERTGEHSTAPTPAGVEPDARRDPPTLTVEAIRSDPPRAE